MKENSAFRKALKVLGSSMVEPYQHVNQDGTTEERNRCAYIQKRIMGGICYQIIKAMEWTQEDTLPKAGDRLARANRRNKGDELSQLEIDRAEAWIMTLGEQLIEQEAMLAEAVEAYDHATGDDYYAGLRKDPQAGPTTSNSKAAEAILLKFAKKEKAAA